MAVKKAVKKTEVAGVTIDLRVTSEISHYLNKIAQLSMTTPSTVAAVILALEVEWIQRKGAIKK